MSRISEIESSESNSIVKRTIQSNTLTNKIAYGIRIADVPTTRYFRVLSLPGLTNPYRFNS